MSQRYFKIKRTILQKIGDAGKSIIKHWPFTVSILIFFTLVILIWNAVPGNVLEGLNSMVINAASILTAVLITFLVARVIQIREEKKAVWNDYHRLTQRMHHFRGAIYPLYSSRDFWPKQVKFEMENEYKELTFYEVRKVTFVDGTPLSPLAQKFISEAGGAKNLYLQLRTFFKGDVPHDISMFKGEFDSFLYYDHDELERWIIFNCGNGLYYYFNHEWADYKSVFDFSKISYHDQKSVKEHCKMLDAARYQDIDFGRDLYDSIGQQFTSQLLPDLYKLSGIVNAGLPHSVRLLTILLTLLIPLGIMVPFVITLGLLPPEFTIIAVCGILSLLAYITLTFHSLLSREIKITHFD